MQGATMAEIDLSSFYPKTLQITQVINSKKEIHVYMKSQTHSHDCPLCKQECKDYHSTYRRKAQDLPILGKTVYVHLTAYRYYCRNSKCRQKVFCETIGDFFGFYKRITGRLEDFVVALAVNTSCEGASRVCSLIGIKISGDTLIRRILKKASGIEPVKTDMIGVDDWAYKKGRTYGTIIVDGRTHKPIDLLNGRDGETLKGWLKQNQQVKIVTRDRASAYASAITDVLPQAMQIADRFHLHQNLLDAIKSVAAQEIPSKVKIMQSLEQQAAEKAAKPEKKRVLKTLKKKA
jgi:transposase